MLKPRPGWNDCAAACARASVVAVLATRIIEAMAYPS